MEGGVPGGRQRPEVRINHKQIPRNQQQSDRMQFEPKGPKYKKPMGGTLNDQDRETDMKVINFSSFPLESRHTSLLQKGMSFSPMNTMDEFIIYKDVVLFLRKVFLRFLHMCRTDSNAITTNTTSNDEILQILNSLLEENEELAQDSPSMPSKTSSP